MTSDSTAGVGGHPVAALKARLARGDLIAAINPAGANADLVEPLKGAGADLLFIDCERTGIGLDAAAQMIRAARAAGLADIVRSPNADPATLVQFQDRRTGGIVVPHVDDAAQTARIVELVRYARGPAVKDTLVVVQVETPAAVENIDAMAAVEGVDVFLIGPNDLAYEMTGARGQRTPAVDRAIDHVCERLRKAGRCYGMPAKLDEIDRFRARGCQLVYYPVEWLLARAVRELQGVLAGG